MNETGSGVPPVRERSVRAVSHAVQLLKLLGRSSKHMRVTDLARETGLTKATVSQLLSTLRNEGLVVQDPDTRRYGLGWEVLELGANLVPSAPVVAVASRYLFSLAQRTGETALLGVLDACTVLFVDVATSPLPIQLVAQKGKREPIHATASGKVLLAGQSDAYLDSFLEGELRPYTPDTITDTGLLREEIARVRENGYGTCWEEHQVGVCGMAVPIRGNGGSVAAAFGVAAPSWRLNSTNLEPSLTEVRAVADEITKTLGHQP